MSASCSAGRALGDDVADRPRERRDEHEQQADERRRRAAAGSCRRRAARRRASRSPAPTTFSPCNRSPRNAMPRPIVKNTCTWITIDDSPAGMPSFMPRNSRPNWKTPMARPYAMTTPAGIRGRANEEHQRHGGEEKAQRGERERRHFPQADLDRHERKSPHRDDDENEREIARGETTIHRPCAGSMSACVLFNIPVRLFDGETRASRRPTVVEID